MNINRNSERGYTLGELLGCLTLGACALAAGYVGTIVGEKINEHLNYSSVQQKVLSVADTNKNGVLEPDEEMAMLREMGIVVRPGQNFADLDIPYKNLEDYLESRK